MDLLQLQYFCTVARLQHMTRAAEELRISQPALSVTVRSLERELGAPLFDRVGRGLALNDFGREVLPHAQTLLAQAEFIRRAGADFSGSDGAGSVHVVTPVPRLTTDAIAAFSASGSDITVYQSICGRDEVIRRLELGRADLAVSDLPIVSDKFVWRPVWQERLVAFLPAGDPLGAREKLRIEDLAGRDTVRSSEEVGLNRIVDELCFRAGMTRKTVMEVIDFYTAIRMVACGAGGFIGSRLIQDAAARFPEKTGFDSVQTVPVEGEGCTWEIGVVTARASYHSRSAAFFYRFLMEYYAKNHCVLT